MLSQNFREHFFKIMGIIGTRVKIFREQGNKDPPWEGLKVVRNKNGTFLLVNLLEFFTLLMLTI